VSDVHGPHPISDLSTEDWTPAIAGAQLPDGKAVRVTVDGDEIFLCRLGDRIFALDNRCNHMGGPLHKGVVKGDPQPTVTCPVHGSIFWLTDGRVVRGPASRPQPVFETRVNDGMVEVRRRADPTEP
jgi:nitrite reductase/ring-hydroxylating ferredoxin subunit